MANTSSRTLTLLSLLQSHRHWSGADLADRLGISERTLRRDVDRLRELGYPVRASRGTDGGYQLAPGAVLPPLLLDDEEGVALAVGMGNAAQSGIADVEEAAVRALTKVMQVLPPRLRARVNALRAMTVSATPTGPVVPADVLTAIAQACRDQERLCFQYTARGGSQTEREVEPHRLVALGGRWYLAAYDLARHDWRSFRLDRLTRPRSTGAGFRQRPLPGGDAAAFVRASAQVPTAHTVVALVHAPAEQIRRMVGQWGRIEPVGQDRCRLTMVSTSLDWPTQALGNVGAAFDVIEPPEFVDHLRDWGTRFLDAVDRSAAPAEEKP
ncbi:helix-turn-helix transcriptional regulator [Actinomadura citrea]|uniref:Putative DNA-binding transcriptional regulator YafY n=1 Tax=Actinomadura citrea TaxID=46158 RepID=A0A7Y9G8T4_9ACTN|nr:YafY family protein [Actinomadura citrea]NYE12014.1 putative DNA-binding transcriptional regulator YafY [Actinomadura citrea]GGT48960.1 DeoR family transcriptional regulator [Actinomadura citrea]